MLREECYLHIGAVFQPPPIFWVKKGAGWPAPFSCMLNNIVFLFIFHHLIFCFANCCSFVLEHGWVVTRHDPPDPETRWTKVAKAPKVIHLDLMVLERDHPDKIADPFQVLSEFDARWVADARWTYACHFQPPAYITKQYIDKKKEPSWNTALNSIVPQQLKPEKNQGRTSLVFKGHDTL
jgi:hypothetical protein